MMAIGVITLVLVALPLLASMVCLGVRVRVKASEILSHFQGCSGMLGMDDDTNAHWIAFYLLKWRGKVHGTPSRIIHDNERTQ